MMGTLAMDLHPAEASGVGGLPRKSPHTNLLPLEHIVVAEPPADYTAGHLTDDVLIGKLRYIRGQKVMPLLRRRLREGAVDRDLAELYGVKPIRLREQVKRNIARFPEQFMPACRTGRFELTKEEAENSRSQFGTLKQGENIKYLPMAFTEQGVAMLSSVLNSEQAILVNIHIIRVFTRMREVLLTHRELLQKLEQLEGRLTGHDEEIQAIFDHLTELVSPTEQARKPTLLRRSGFAKAQ